MPVLCIRPVRLDSHPAAAVTPEAIFGVLIAALAGNFGLWLRHIVDCRDRDRRAAEAQERLTKAIEAFRVHLEFVTQELERLARNAHDDREYLRGVGTQCALNAERMEAMSARSHASSAE